MTREKLIKLYKEKHLGNNFTVYNRLYLFGEVINDGDVKIIFGNDNNYAVYDIEFIFNSIKNKLWDTTTYVRKQKLKKLLDANK